MKFSLFAAASAIAFSQASAFVELTTFEYEGETFTCFDACSCAPGCIDDFCMEDGSFPDAAVGVPAFTWAGSPEATRGYYDLDCSVTTEVFVSSTATPFPPQGIPSLGISNPFPTPLQADPAFFLYCDMLDCYYNCLDQFPPSSPEGLVFCVLSQCDPDGDTGLDGVCVECANPDLFDGSPTTGGSPTGGQDTTSTGGLHAFDCNEKCVPVENLSRGLDGGCMGDPHFKRWNGKFYDFHGICDLVLVQAKELNLTVHIRTKGRYQYSYIEAAAIQLGDDTLEVGSWGEYWLNGVERADVPTMMAGKFQVSYESPEEKKHSFRISLDAGKEGYKGEALKITTFKDMVSVTVENASADHFATSVGMMGRYADGAFVSRDGTMMAEDDFDAFGREWHVLATEPQLFQSPSQHLGSSCVPPTKTGRRLGQTISQEAAEMACSHHEDEEMKDMCIFDVIAMDDLEVAEAHGAF